MKRRVDPADRVTPRGDLDAAAVLKRLQADAGNLVRVIDSAEDRRAALLELGGNAVDKAALAKVEVRGGRALHR